MLKIFPEKLKGDINTYLKQKEQCYVKLALVELVQILTGIEKRNNGLAEQSCGPRKDRLPYLQYRLSHRERLIWGHYQPESNSKA